jgi:hypothetical protein
MSDLGMGGPGVGKRTLPAVPSLGYTKLSPRVPIISSLCSVMLGVMGWDCGCDLVLFAAGCVILCMWVSLCCCLGLTGVRLLMGGGLVLAPAAAVL